jgi:hypothetical protein
VQGLVQECHVLQQCQLYCCSMACRGYFRCVRLEQALRCCCGGESLLMQNLLQLFQCTCCNPVQYMFSASCAADLSQFCTSCKGFVQRVMNRVRVSHSGIDIDGYGMDIIHQISCLAEEAKAKTPASKCIEGRCVVSAARPVVSRIVAKPLRSWILTVQCMRSSSVGRR